ncbi:DJ-1/PfpI family protein [Bacillus sp. FJAT-49705]|uniref:DJ-1/PfpI family protein n=1 Tax=Cytobacillus citreus TaxID=2833586 RepID=A0ABS5NY08_9BACI|nr:DJ-1/PfpI family protein [Cytobacillus citreus]
MALEKSPCKSEARLNTIPDLTIKETLHSEYDVLIIPGGDLRPIAYANELFEWVKNFAKLGKVIGAICSGVYVLAKSGVLKDIPYTVTLSKEQRNFLNCFDEEKFSYEPLVKEKNIITAQGHAYVDFGIQLNKMIRDVRDESIDFYIGKRNHYMEMDD